MTAILRTRTIDESAGFMKVLVEKAGDRILGFTMIGPEAGEVMAAVQTAMLGGLPPLCSLAGRDPHPPHDGGRTGQPLRRRNTVRKPFDVYLQLRWDPHRRGHVTPGG
jgi:hypothetical protein